MRRRLRGIGVGVDYADLTEEGEEAIAELQDALTELVTGLTDSAEDLVDVWDSYFATFSDKLAVLENIFGNLENDGLPMTAALAGLSDDMTALSAYDYLEQIAYSPVNAWIEWFEKNRDLISLAKDSAAKLSSAINKLAYLT